MYFKFRKWTVVSKSFLYKHKFKMCPLDISKVLKLLH